MICMDREAVGPAPGWEALRWALREHRKALGRLERLRAYYEGQNPAILQKERGSGQPNLRLPHPFGRYITLTASGYLTGRPIRYASPGQEEALARLLRRFGRCALDSVDSELSVNASVYGKGVERVYLDEEGAPRSVSLSPLEAFVVYDDTVAHQPLFGVTLIPKAGPDGAGEGTLIEVLTADAVFTWTASGRDPATARMIAESPHPFRETPLIEYWNNFDEAGDFEGVLPLIDGYDLLQSDRLNDKEQFADSLLVLTGCQLGETFHTRRRVAEDGTLVEERVPDEDPAARLRRDRCLSLPDSDASAQYLTHTLHEADTEVLRAALREDIHKFSFIPDLSDRSFSQNASGVAIRYKLMGLEQLASVKERWFREALRARLRLDAAWLEAAEDIRLDAEQVEIRFERALITGEEEG